MAIIMTSGRFALFTRRPLTSDDEEALKDRIKAAVFGICDGVADVDIAPQDTVSLTEIVGKDALWKRGFDPDILVDEESSG